MVGLKKQSKRMTTKKRVKIERKVKEHNKKKRKEARKNPRKGKKKDPGVPSSLPFKETVLKELEQTKKQAEEERAKKREMLKKKRQKSRENLQNKNRNLADFVADAEKRQAEYEKKQAKEKADDLKSYHTASTETSRQTYVKEFRKVVEASDVVLEVVDARDPLGTRCQELKEAFDINTATLSGLPSKCGKSPLMVDSLGPVSAIVDPASLPADDMEDDDDEEEESEEDMEEEEEAKDTKTDAMNPIMRVTQKGKGAESSEEKVTVLQANKARKKAFKQMKKNRKRADAVAGNLSSAMETAFNIGLGDDDDSDEDL